MFKVGDSVRRTHGQWNDMNVGDSDVIESIETNADGDTWLNLVKHGWGHTAKYFELVEPDTTNHHQHHDLIIAWAKGAEIEVRFPYETQWVRADDPQWACDLEYRIKPTNPERIARIECELKRLADELKELRDE